jgi:hypothetical protein
MDTQREQTEGSSTFWLSLSPLVDFLSKGVAGVAVALYASGFLVVSLHHSRYGFSGINPFRPRILAAGAWFFLFALFPVVVTMRYTGGKPLPWKKLLLYLYPNYVGSYSIAVLASPLFTFAGPPAAAAPSRWWWAWLVGALVSLGVLVFLMQSKRVPQSVSATVSVALVVFFAQGAGRELFMTGRFQFSSVALWFFGVGILTICELNVRSNDRDWMKSLIPFLAALMVFAWFYYPNMKAAWGGGAPVDATIYFTKDSAIRAGQSVVAHLVEESDEGFYIVGLNETRAVYVPRNSVALIYFSGQPSGSALLQPKP